MNLSAYTALIFDVGDTLLYTWPSRKEAMCIRLKQAGILVDQAQADKMMTDILSAERDQIRKEQNGAPRMEDDEFIKMVDLIALDSIGMKSPPELLHAIPLPQSEMRLIDGVKETLVQLKKEGFRLVIVSNHYAWLRNELHRVGIDQYFEEIIISEEVGVEKPDPRILQIALERCKLSADKCLYIGDHPYDVLCAGQIGMDCAWIAADEAILPAEVSYRECFRIRQVADLLM